MIVDWAVHWLGEIPFRKAWDVQNRVAAEVVSGNRPPTLLLLEHPHTFSLGSQGQLENLLWSEQELKQRGVDLIWTDRGGDITYHGPGQLVGYPILPLGRVDKDQHLPQADYVGYLRRLEEVIVRALASFGIVSGQLKGKTGVWVQPDVASRCRHCPPSARKRPSKIASIGVKVDANGVSRHGFSINVSPDMSYWDGIVACGLIDDPAISMAQLMESPPSLDQVNVQVVDAFGKAFSARPVMQPIDDEIMMGEQEQQP